METGSEWVPPLSVVGYGPPGVDEATHQQMLDNGWQWDIAMQRYWCGDYRKGTLVSVHRVGTQGKWGCPAAMLGLSPAFDSPVVAAAAILLSR